MCQLDRLYAVSAALLLPCASIAAPDDLDGASRRPVHVGLLIGIVSVPRPLDVELQVRINDLFAVGLGYSDFPAFVADPLLEAVGAKGGSTTARLDEFSALDVDLRVMPFRGAFFVGTSFGRQKLRGAITESGQTATVDLKLTYATPRIGWQWTLGPGFLLGFDFGAQLKLSGEPTVTVPPGASQSQIDKAHKLVDVGSSYPLPSLRLRIGWMI